MVVAQIEDLEALQQVEAIAAVDGIDCVFIGRIDLTVALGADSPNDSRVLDAVERICTQAAGAGCPVGMFVPSVAEASRWLAMGARVFLLESDQSFLMNGARQLRQAFTEAEAAAR